MKKKYIYGFGAVMAAFLCVAFAVHAAVPAVINYQSRLRTVAGAPITSATRVSFSLYSVAMGGSALWTESYNQSSGACAKVMPDANGYFSVQMGSCSAFPATLTFTTPLYLGVTVENDAEASPRVAFAPAPYALNSVRVGNFVSDTAANTLTGEPVGTATVLAQNKNSSALVLQGSAWNGSSAATKDFKLQVVPTTASNYRFGVFDNAGAGELVSVLNNGNVGIGTTAPTETLHVAGTAKFTNTVTVHDIMPDGDNLYDLGTHTNRFRTGYFKDVVYGDTVRLGSENNADYAKFTLPKFFITASSTTSDLQVQLAQFEPTGVTFLEDTAFNKLVSIPARQIKFGLNTFTFPVAAPASNGLVLTTDADGTLSWTTKSTGSVTSVGLSAPSEFTLTGSPVTASGTLGIAWKNQQPNDVLAGPSSGASSAAPSFRSLVPSDIPTLDIATKTSGVLTTTRGGTGISTYAKGQIVYADAINSLATLGIGSANQVLTVDATGVPAWKALPSDAGGTVKSVGLTAPSIFSVIGTPITDAGTINLNLAAQAPNTFFSGADTVLAGNIQPSFRAIVPQDIPALDASKIATGVFNPARIPAIASSSVPDLDASKITSGIFDIARIPSIPAASVTGALAVANIPALDASQVTTGVFNPARIPAISSSSIPNLDASKITTGVFDIARIPNIPVTRGGTGMTSNAKGDILYGDAINSLAALGIGSTGQVLTVNSAGLPVWSAPASGVTSVGLSLPPLFTVSGSPVTGAGTLSAALATQTANTIFAGPSSGAAAAPAFRSLAAADIPALDASQITTGVFNAARIPAVASSSIPNLDASKITTGVFNIARIPNIPAGNITGTIASSSIPSLDASKIGSGVLGTANGGTGLSSVGANGTVLTSVAGTPTWSPVPAGLGGTGSFGQLAFWNSSSTLAGNSKIIIDNTNGRLAVGTSTAPATTLVVGGDTTVGGDIVPSTGSSFDLGSATKHIRNAYIDDLYIYGGGGSGTSTISATQTVFNGVAYNWPNGGLGNNFVLTTDTNGNLGWQNATNLVPESGFRGASGVVRLGVASDKVGIGTATPATKLDVVGDIQASGFLSSATGQIKFGGATYNFPTTLPSAGQVLTASSSGALAWQAPAAAGVAGSGVAGKMALWNASGTIASSALSQSATEIGTSMNTRLSGTVWLGEDWASGAQVGIYAPTKITSSLSVNGPSFFRGDLNIGMPNGPEAGIGALKINNGSLVISYGAGAGKVLTSDSAGTATWQVPAAGGVAGSGTANKLALWSATGTIADSIISQSGSSIAIGGGVSATGAASFATTTVTGDLSVSGRASIAGLTSLNGGLKIATGAGAGKVLTSDASGNAVWQVPSTTTSSVAVSSWISGAGKITLATSTDSVGIGTATPNNRLQVAGLINFDDALSSYSLGTQAGQDNTATSNVFFGRMAGLHSTSGSNNTFLGDRSGANNGTGSDNVGIGSSAMVSATGSFNIGIGSLAVERATGISNIGIGSQALRFNVVGADNVAIGGGAMSNNTGSRTVALGTGAGTTLSGPTTPNAVSDSVFLGYMAAPATPGMTNVVVIGSNVKATQDNQVVIGNASTTQTLLRGVETNALKITGGTPAAGKVLTSDAFGNATWQLAGGSGLPAGGTAGQVLTVAGGVPTWLTPVSGASLAAVAQNIIPDSTNTRDIGALSAAFARGYFQDLYVSRAATISSTLTLPNGAGAGKVLTSDASGNATWQAPSAGGAGLPASVAAGTALLSPIGSAGAPAFRALTALDIPSLDTSKITTGVLPVANGGTGLSSVGAAGQVLTVVNGVPAWQSPASVGASQWTSATGTWGNRIYNAGKVVVGSSAESAAQLSISSPASSVGLEVGFTAGGGNNYLNVDAYRTSFGGQITIPNNKAITMFSDPNSSNGLDVLKIDSTGNTLLGALNGLKFQFSGTTRASINTSGAYSQSSDVRLKEGVGDIKDALGLISRLRGVTFNWKDSKKKDVGFIAQEVEKVIPEVVSTDSQGYKSLAYGNLAAVAIQGVKELNAKVDAPVTHAILPAEDNVYDLGSPSHRFRSLYIGPHSVHFMNDAGEAIGTLDVPDDGQNKGKVVVNVNGKETVLGGDSGSCGTLCSLLTANVKDGKATVAAAVPDVDLGDAKMRLKNVFANTLNANNFEMAMANPELATAAVGKMLGIVSADGVNAKIGLVDVKDARTTVLVADMEQAKRDIASLKAQLAQVQAALAMRVKDAGACRSETIPAQVDKTVGSGDWVVSPLTVSPKKLPVSSAPLIQI